MQITTAYQGRSRVAGAGQGMSLSFSPNLRRDRVSFLGNLKSPLLFREAVSALHDIVVSDLKWKPKDRTAYQAYLKQIQAREMKIRQLAYQQTQQDLRDETAGTLTKELEKGFRNKRDYYWKLRQKYSNYLAKNDPELFRLLVPCDPVITVAPDTLFYECFSKDESSYGCLTIDRNDYLAQDAVSLGTTNVDYSQELYEGFQRLRTYRPTRFAIDPSGFSVQTQDSPDYREEKIDLPPSWLQGFMQLQAAMSLPMRHVSINREAMYNILGLLKRNRTKTSPRAIRFELTPGSIPKIVLEPWELTIPLHTQPYQGQRIEDIRIWGRDRLLTLQRLLPVMDQIDVYLLGTGLPSFWSVRMGSIRLLLGLSGWTANDWTSGGSALADLAPPVEPSEDLLGDIAIAFQESPLLTFEQIRQRTGAAPHFVAAGLNRFALLGQVIQDLAGGVYRWRTILPAEVALNQVKIESPELEGARQLVEQNRVKLTRNEVVGTNRLLVGVIDGKPVEAVLDSDHRISKGQCNCSHYFRFKLRAGPCRHMQALRRVASGEKSAKSIEQWYAGLSR
jgi:hypothetical protein